MRTVFDPPAQHFGGDPLQFCRAGIPAGFDGGLAGNRVQQRIPGGGRIRYPALAQMFQDFLHGRDRVLGEDAGRHRAKDDGVLAERLQLETEVGKNLAEFIEEIPLL